MERNVNGDGIGIEAREENILEPDFFNRGPQYGPLELNILERVENGLNEEESDSELEDEEIA